MFGIISRVISSVAAFLFPIFASYKALKANDQTQLTPWLMYWIVIACVVVVENLMGWFLNLLPLYQDVKAIFLLWLVLPQTQGATYLYITYIHPYLSQHETDIENLISSGHDQLRRNGVIYLRRLYVIIQQLIGLPPGEAPRPPTPPQPSQTQSYAQLLLQKFSLPPIGPFDPASTFLSSLFSTFSTAQAPNTSAPQARGDLTASSMIGSFALPNLPREQQLSYIEAQKRKLVEYIKFLDDAAAQHHNEDLSSPLSYPVSPPSQTVHSRNVSTASMPIPFPTAGSPQLSEEGFESVSAEDVVASGVAATTPSAERRGWFGWGVSTPNTLPYPETD